MCMGGVFYTVYFFYFLRSVGDRITQSALRKVVSEPIVMQY
jgi:hypothetical protein